MQAFCGLLLRKAEMAPFQGPFLRLHAKITLFRSLLSFHQGAGHLVRARGGFEAAGDSLTPGDYIVDFHSFYQRANSLAVAIAAAHHLSGFYCVAVELHNNLGRTGSMCFVSIFHRKTSCEKLAPGLQHLGLAFFQRVHLRVGSQKGPDRIADTGIHSVKICSASHKKLIFRSNFH